MKPDPYIEHLLTQYSHPAFIDEVGLGCIFGEHVACAILLPGDFDPRDVEEVDDSKKLKHADVYRLAHYLIPKVTYSFGVVSCQELKQIRNMHKANKLAMKRAIEGLPIVPDSLFIDGKFGISGHTLPVYTIVKGDAKVFGIAVASIIAKDYRDHLVMEKYGQDFSDYHIRSNKGYRSPDHLIAIRKLGVTEHHRTWMPQVQQVLSGGYDEVIKRKYPDRWKEKLCL